MAAGLGGAASATLLDLGDLEEELKSLSALTSIC
jgi:hypothetical protein